MDGFSISQAARRTGFPPSTLRFYEQSGLVRPDRTPSGYRRYDEHHLELLAFIGRAKSFGLSLEEITGVLSLLDDDRCAPVQHRLRDLVDAKITDARRRIAELTAFAAELHAVAEALRVHTADGPCDDACGCTTATAGARAGDPGPIACTLAPDQVADRLRAWQAVVSASVGQQAIVEGLRFRLPDDTDVAALAALARAEQQCCRFFSFALILDPAGVALDITGPPDAQPVIRALVGAAA